MESRASAVCVGARGDPRVQMKLPSSRELARRLKRVHCCLPKVQSARSHAVYTLPLLECALPLSVTVETEGVALGERVFKLNRPAKVYRGGVGVLGRLQFAALLTTPNSDQVLDRRNGLAGL